MQYIRNLDLSKQVTQIIDQILNTTILIIGIGIGCLHHRLMVKNLESGLSVLRLK